MKKIIISILLVMTQVCMAEKEYRCIDTMMKQSIQDQDLKTTLQKNIASGNVCNDFESIKAFAYEQWNNFWTQKNKNGYPKYYACDDYCVKQFDPYEEDNSIEAKVFGKWDFTFPSALSKEKYFIARILKSVGYNHLSVSKKRKVCLKSETRWQLWNSYQVCTQYGFLDKHQFDLDVNSLNYTAFYQDNKTSYIDTGRCTVLNISKVERYKKAFVNQFLALEGSGL